MRSLLGGLAERVAPRRPTPAPAVRNAARVDLAPPHLSTFGVAAVDGESQLRAMGQVGTLFSIVDRISGSVSRVDWHLYRVAPSGKEEDREPITSHAAWDLWQRPNPRMPGQTFREIIAQHLELVGETPWLAARHERFRSLGPIELWPLRPDRIIPVPDPRTFLGGYFYRSPGGERVPLELDEVIRTMRPCPWDPYRGLGLVQTIAVELDSSRATAEWNRNFFRNSAQPGGVVEYPEELEDEDFERIVDRWRAQHQGVSNSHRVAVLEAGAKWVERKYSQRDMEFVALRGATRDAIIEASGVHRATLGITEDVNRAASVTARTQFAEDIVIPRLERLRGVLNFQLLPMFGSTAAGLEFDFDDPRPKDTEAENAERDSKTRAWATLVAAGADEKAAAEVVGLPEIPLREQITVTPPPQQPPPAADPAPEARRRRRSQRLRAELDPPAGPQPDDVEAVDGIDLSPVQATFEAALAALLASWAGRILVDWIDRLVDQVRTILRGDGGRLAHLTVPTRDAVDLVTDALADLADEAAGQVVDEAAGQDVTLSPATPRRGDLEDAATTTVELLGQVYKLAAAREAQRLNGPGADPDDVAERVGEHLESLSDAQPAKELGAALTATQNAARAATLRGGPVGAVYASEQLDGNTCGPCRQVHGRWICNTDDLGPVWALYPTAGYVDCQGGVRCRGTFVGVWRQKRKDAA
ncbi:MAG TPA: phage portal protein [Pseudonocardiaceae bacterium]